MKAAGKGADFTLVSVDSVQSKSTVNRDGLRSNIAFVNTATSRGSNNHYVTIDFRDFDALEGDPDAKAALSVGLTLLHEFGHEVDGRKEDSGDNENDPGLVERDYMLKIYDELGLPQRQNYVPKRDGDYRIINYVGKDGKTKVAKWKNSVVGGRGLS